MSKTTLEVIDLLYVLVNASDLMTMPEKPNGGLYKTTRPVNSPLEDVVINSLTLGREAVQEGVLNVNLFVPNLILKLNGVIDNSQANFPRLKFLAAKASEVLNEIWDEEGEYTFNAQQDQLFDDTNNQHYINFRVEFYSQNIN